MYLLRRVGAATIDGLLFGVAMLLVGFLCSSLNVMDGEFEVGFPIFSGLLTSILLPILLFSSTIGEKIFRLRPIQVTGRSLKIGLLLKYLIVYSFLSFAILNTVDFFRDVLSTYTIFAVSEFFVIRLLAAVWLANIIFFIGSLGQCSLFDRVFRISYGPVGPRRWYLSAGFAVTVFVLIMVEGMIVDWKFHKFFPTKRIISYGNSATQINFSPEKFDAYTVNGLIYGRVYLTDMLVTTSDMNSFVQDKFLYQRQIEAQINDSLLINPKKRYELCVKLLEYVYGVMDLSDTNRIIKQTKIELVHMRHITPFIGIAQYFNYYFDDTVGRHGIYGGFDWDTLTIYYLKTKKNVNDSLASIISTAMGISKDSAGYYLEHHDSAQLARLITPKVQNQWFSIELGPLIDRRILTMRPIAFDSVKPIRRVNFASDYVQFEIFGGPFYDTQEIGTIGMRNSLGFRAVQ